MQPPIPILRSHDEAETRAFYLDLLGFETVFEHRFAPDMPLYLSVRRGACELHLSEHRGDAAPGAGLRIQVPDVHLLAAELAERWTDGAPPSVTTQPWGWHDMSVTDPAGNRLIFCTPAPAGR